MDTLAARLRESFLGTETGEAVPFDELKDAVKDRWQRVADAAAIRVPFSDDQIERMARAAYTARMRREEKSRCWDEIQLMSKDAWRQGIRAALAAGGLEPCTVPEYDPSDVALSPTGHVLRDRLVEAEAKIERQRKNLNQLYMANAALRNDINIAVCNAMDRLPDAPWKDKTATEAVWLLSLAVGNLRAEVDEDNAAAASVNDLLVQVQNLTAERDALRERASVPVPAGDTPDDQVEALARVLCDAYCASNKNYGQEWDGLREIGRSHYMAEARAAIAHLHKRPEGLPTLIQIEDAYYTNSERMTEPIEFTLDYLRPWLRDPVGCEMDVTWQEMQEWLEPDSIGRRSSPHEILDLCRSRIRPAYECKECAQWSKDWDSQSKAYEILSKSNSKACKQINSIRAALEGE